MSDMRNALISGTFFHAPVCGSIEILADALVDVDGTGTIREVLTPADSGYAARKSDAARAGTLVSLPVGCYVLPGFVDLHIHAPQYPQLGTALHVPLEVWLQEHTFPLEARYADAAFAERVYDLLVGDLLALGTTTAVFFATIHQEATRRMVDSCLKHGLRALVGKVAMDNVDSCPDYYRDASVDAALEETQALIDYVRAHPANGAGLVLPVVTPRFIPACTDPLLEGLGALARSNSCHVQTHCSESDWEHSVVFERYGRSDAAALDGFGLLGRTTVLAHCNFLSASDMDVMAGRGAGVAHCPLSNIYFAGAVFPLRRALAKGLRVGLGTDISGGPSASLLDNCRAAVAASRLLEDGVDPLLARAARGQADARVDWKTAFHLATAGGADVLDLPIGSIQPGRQFDAILIDAAAPLGTIRTLDGVDDPENVLQKIIYNASRANIRDVWIAGRRVAGAGTG